MSDQTPLIQVIGLKKIYGSGESLVEALAGIDLSITESEFVAIMGPSGSGKSTLLNLLACLDRPSDGKYLLAGEDVSKYSRSDLAHIRSQQLGFIFQSYNLLPRLTAVENVLMPIMYQHTGRPPSSAEQYKRAMVALDAVGIANRAMHLPNQLSGGQQQRVAIARALINDPLVILADEPTGNLDTRSSEEILSLLLDLHDRGRTLVMVTHEEEVAHHTERILWIRDGKLAADHQNGESKPMRVDLSARNEHKESPL